MSQASVSGWEAFEVHGWLRPGNVLETSVVECPHCAWSGESAGWIGLGDAVNMARAHLEQAHPGLIS